MKEKLLLGLIVAAIGIVMVFIILGLLIISVNLVSIAMKGIVKRNERTKQKKEKQIESNSINNEIDLDNSENESIVAAITSAIAVYLEEDKAKSHTEFRISKIRKC